MQRPSRPVQPEQQIWLHGPSAKTTQLWFSAEYNRSEAHRAGGV